MRLTKSRKWIFFFLGWVGMVLYFTQRWLLGPLIPELMTVFNANQTSLGAIGSASMWGYMFTPLLAGWLSDRFGRKHMVLAGIFGFSSLTLLCGLATSAHQLFWARFFTGAAEAFFFIPLIAFTLELFPERPGFYLTLMSSGTSVGWFLGPSLAGCLLEMTGSWRNPFLVTGLLGLAVTAMLFLSWPGEKRVASKEPFFHRAMLSRLNLGLLILLGLATASQLAAEFGFTMWYPAFLEMEIHMTPASAGVLAGIFGLGQFLGRPLFGWVSDRLGYRSVGVVCGAVFGLSLLLILQTQSAPYRAFFTFQAGFIGAAVMGALWTFTGLMYPRAKGLALGVITTMGYACGSFAPLLIGSLADRASVSLGLGVVCAPAAFLTAILLLATFAAKASLKNS
jgi:MFS family permease